MPGTRKNALRMAPEQRLSIFPRSGITVILITMAVKKRGLSRQRATPEQRVLTFIPFTC